MLKKLKEILNTYYNEELEEMEFWVNSSRKIEYVIIDDHSIDLITNGLRLDLKDEKNEKKN